MQCTFLSLSPRYFLNTYGIEGPQIGSLRSGFLFYSNHFRPVPCASDHQPVVLLLMKLYVAALLGIYRGNTSW